MDFSLLLYSKRQTFIWLVSKDFHGLHFKTWTHVMACNTEQSSRGSSSMSLKENTTDSLWMPPGDSVNHRFLQETTSPSPAE